MPQQVRRRKHTTIAYSANNKVSEDLSRGMVLRELYLHLSGQLTCVAGNNTYAATLRGDEWACVKRIDLVANGTDVIRSISGDALRFYNFFMNAKFPCVSTLLGAGGADPTFESVLILPLWMPRSIRPIDTALDSRELSDLTLEVTWGSHLSINAGSTGFTVAPTIQVYALESFNVSGPFAQSRMFPIVSTITASNAQHKIRLPVGPMYRGFLINTEDADVDDGDVINNLKVVSGSTVFLDMNETLLRHVDRQRNGAILSYSGTAYHDVAQADNTNCEGWYFVDMLSDGMLSECIDTLGFSEFELEADVTVGAGTTKMNVWPIQVFPIRGKAA